jgi:putative endonuclease
MSVHTTHLTYWVYILAGKPHGTIYVGVTNSLERRTWQHKAGSLEGFTKRYGVSRLVYLEDFRDVSNAIARETQLKGWLRAKKVALIQKQNPLWRDLAEEWYDLPVDSSLRSE